MRNRKKRGKNKESQIFIESFLFKFTTKSLLGAFVVLMFLTLVQCSVKKPEAPSWNTQFTVPVVNRTFYMGELLDRLDQEGVGIDSLGGVTFSVTRDIDTVTLGQDVLSTDDLFYSIAESLGSVEIDAPQTTPLTVSLAAISGLATGLPGDSAVVVPIDFTVNNAVPTVTTFSQATVDTGGVLAVVENSLGIDLDTVIVQVWDVTNSRYIATDTFLNPIVDGATDSLVLPLDGETVSNELRLDTYCYTPGGVVEAASTRYISTEIGFASALTVSSAVAEVPALNRNYTQPVALGEAQQVDSASMASGTLILVIANETNLSADLDIAIPDFVQGGTPLTISRSVPPQQTVNVNVDLAGYTLIPTDVTVPQQLSMDVTADIPGTAPQQIVIDQSDRFTISASLSGLTFGSISGVLDNEATEFNLTQEGIDVPQGFDSLEFTNVQVSLDIDNHFDLPGYLDILLTGDNGRTLNITGNVLPDAMTTISRGDAAVAQFLSPIPSNIEVTGTTTFGDGVYHSTITADDFVSGQVRIYAPLEVIIHEAVIETDLEKEEIDQANITDITDHVQEARFIYNITNRLPVGAHVNIYLSGDSATLYTNPQLVIDSLFVTAAPFDASGLATDVASTGEQQIYLTNEDIRVLENEVLYIGQEIVLESSGGQIVKLSQDDYLNVVARIEVEYLVNGDL